MLLNLPPVEFIGLRKKNKQTNYTSTPSERKKKKKNLKNVVSGSRQFLSRKSTGYEGVVTRVGKG